MIKKYRATIRIWFGEWVFMSPFWCRGTELRWNNPWFWRQLSALVFTEVTNQSFSVSWQYTNQLQVPTHPHQVPKHNLELQPTTAQHSSTQRNWEFVVFLGCWSIRKRWYEGMKPGSLPLGVGHSTNVGGNTRMQNRNTMSFIPFPITSL